MATYILMAGGTGGHLFPAMALAQELVRRGHQVHLATDERVQGYGGDFPAAKIHVIPSATPSLKNPLGFVGAGFRILSGILASFSMLREVKPDGVVAFGGYPCFPPFLAASIMGIPGLLHEQNAIAGRANRALARFARSIAVQFEKTHGFNKSNLIVTGNPVRDIVMDAASIDYPELDDKSPFFLLVFGGSQGARAFSRFIPPVIAALPDHIRLRLYIWQQCRSEDLDQVTRVYSKARINVEISTFFTDLPQRMARSHLVIGRAGATTIAELGVIGRPAILVPLPGSLDQDQRANALLMQEAGGGWLVDQDMLSTQSEGKSPEFAKQLEELLGNTKMLKAAAKKAKSLGRKDAVQRLADAAEKLHEREMGPETAVGSESKK